MRFNVYTSEGIIIRTHDFGEADRILTIVTPEKGKLKLIAKGVRRLKSKRRGHIDIFAKVSFTAHTSKLLDSLTEVSTIEFYKNIRESLAKMTLAYYFVEIVDKTLREGETNEEVYQILDMYLDKLTKENPTKTLRLSFLKDILEVLGFLPEKSTEDLDNYTKNLLEQRVNSERVGKKLLEKK